jgi:hypothetical protein
MRPTDGDRSEYFRGLFRSGCAEVESGRIAVRDASPPALRIALTLIYAGRLEEAATSPFPPSPFAEALKAFGPVPGPAPSLSPVLPAADLMGALSLCRMFLLPAGAQLCRDAVLRRLSPATVIDTLIWADANADDALRGAALAYALSNFSAIRESHPAALETLAAAPRDLMLEVLRGLNLK